MSYIKKANRWAFIFLIITLFAFSYLTPSVLAESSTIEWGRITNLNFNGFPDITIQALIRNTNDDPVPISDIQSGVKVLENGVVEDISTKQVNSGVETFIVIDFSSSVPRRRDELISIVNSLIGGLSAEDTMGIILEQSDKTEILQPLTNNTDVLKNTLNKIPESTNTVTIGTKGVELALNELGKSLKKDKLMQSVVLISSGPNIQTDLPTIKQQSKENHAPIHTICLSLKNPSDEEPCPGLEGLTADTKGVYVFYSGTSSLNPIPDWLSSQRTQYQFTYRSKSVSNQERTVELLTTSDTLIGQAVHYTVTMQPPKVIIDSPTNNKEYIRRAPAPGTDMDTVEPTSDQVTAHVEWPDGYPRKLLTAQFYIDGLAEGSPLNQPDDRMTFTLDLRRFRTPGDIPDHQLSVSVKDEFNLEGKTNPTLITITVIIPTPLPEPTNTVAIEITNTPTVTPEPCVEYTGDTYQSRIQYYWCQAKEKAQSYNNLAGFIALGVALFAILLVIIFRNPISRVAVQAGDKVRDAIVSLTRPANAEVVGAYLRVLKGDDALSIKPIPLYINTVTPLGRDMRQAEIVFQSDIEHSVVSRKHCEILEEAGQFRIRDYGSSHGTFVNGYRLPEGGEGQKLEDGDEISLGPIERGGVLLLFQLAAPGGLAPSSGGAVPPVEPRSSSNVTPSLGGFQPYTSETEPGRDNISGITKPAMHDASEPEAAPKGTQQDSRFSYEGVSFPLPDDQQQNQYPPEDIDNAPTYEMPAPDQIISDITPSEEKKDKDMDDDTLKIKPKG